MARGVSGGRTDATCVESARAGTAGSVDFQLSVAAGRGHRRAGGPPGGRAEAVLQGRDTAVTRASIALVIHSLRRFRGVLLGLGLILAAFQFLLTQVAAYLARQSAFSLLSTLIPEFARTAAGPSALAFMSFSGIVGLGYFHPVVLAAVVSLMIAIATEPAAEVEARFVDLTLSRPLTRADIVVRTIVVLIVAVTSTL